MNKLGKITILDYTTKTPIQMMGYHAGVCYKSNISDEQKNFKRGLECLESGHGRVMEFPDVYMNIEGYSARVIRELYTHIGGSPTRLQASTRYIDYTSADMIDVVVPHSVEKNQIAKIVWDTAIYNITKAMNDLKNLNIPNEDLTNLLPLAYSTKMVWKVNLRTLINFFNMRLCSRAYWEIRELCDDLKKELSNYSEEWKTLSKLFTPRCEQLGYCPEKDSCGRKKKKNEC